MFDSQTSGVRPVIETPLNVAVAVVSLSVKNPITKMVFEPETVCAQVRGLTFDCLFPDDASKTKVMIFYFDRCY